MDHPLQTTTALPLHAWRSAAVIATLVAAFELLLLVGAGAALLTRGDSSTPTHRASAAATPKTRAPVKAAAPVHRHAQAVAAPKLTRGRVRVMVLNGNGRQGAASAAAALVHHRGYRVGTVGNAARMSYSHSLVMYRPGYEGEGRRLGRDLGIRFVSPLDGMRPAQFHGAQIALILGA